MNWLKEINNNYAGAIQALTPIMMAIVSFIYYKLFKENQAKEGDAALNILPTFYSLFGKRYKILAVHKYEKSEDVSGYRHLGQNSRPDQWEKLITIKRFGIFGIKYRIIPNNAEDILTVIISRNGTEKWKNVNFNK